jgi:tetratricopeptide (TPR) repeat protein
MLLEIDDQLSVSYYLIGLNYFNLGQYESAIPELEKNLELRTKWGVQSEWVPNYTLLGSAYQKTGQYRKAKKLYKKAEKYFPDDPLLIRRQAILALARGKTKQADEYLAKFESITKDEGASEALIQTRLGLIYEEAGKIEKAEEYFEMPLRWNQKTPVRMKPCLPPD